MKKIFYSLATLFVASSCYKAPTTTNLDVFETYWEEMNTHYAVFEDRGVNWDSLYQVYRPRVTDGISQDSLWDVMSSMMRHLNDAHVSMSNPNGFHPRKYFNSAGSISDFNSFDIVEVGYTLGYSLHDMNSNGALYWIYDFVRNIGYIHISTFDEGNYTLSDIDKLLSKVSMCDAIIIDLRANPGGMTYNAFYLASYFAMNQNTVHYTQKKTGAGSNDFSPPQAHHNYLHENSLSDKVTVVLTNKLTQSASERFLLCAKQFDECTFIGATTSGSYSAPISGILPNGWTYTFSVERVLTPGMIPLEGIGVVPDIYVDNDYLTHYEDSVIIKTYEYLDSKYGI